MFTQERNDFERKFGSLVENVEGNGLL